MYQVKICKKKPFFFLNDFPRFVRASPGGSGFAKLGANYGPTIFVSERARGLGCDQVLWLHGPEEELTEVGAMNVFVLLDRGGNRRELVTPPLDKGIILPGVTRRSIIELVRGWGKAGEQAEAEQAEAEAEVTVAERPICMGELLRANQDGSLVELFGSGTAAVVTPVGSLHYRGRTVELPTPAPGAGGISHRVREEMSDIYYCRKGVEHPWAPEIDEWKVDLHERMDDLEKVAEIGHVEYR